MTQRVALADDREHRGPNGRRRVADQPGIEQRLRDTAQTCCRPARQDRNTELASQTQDDNRDDAQRLRHEDRAGDDLVALGTEAAHDLDGANADHQRASIDQAKPGHRIQRTDSRQREVEQQMGFPQAIEAFAGRAEYAGESEQEQQDWLTAHLFQAGPRRREKGAAAWSRLRFEPAFGHAQEQRSG